MIIYKNEIPDEESLAKLYNDAGWIGYTNDMDKLLSAVKNSLYVLTAWDGDKLAGLIRVVGDGLTIIYIQDILVLKEYKRRGIGRELIERVFKQYEDVRQKVLLTDNQPETVGFYEALGFTNAAKYNMVSFVK